MAAAADAGVVVPIPRPVGRRMSLGPFPSARDAMKFAAYAAAGTLALPFGGPVAWLPFLGGGFVMSVYRPDGKAIDERASDYLRWRWRQRAPARPGTGGRARLQREFVRLPGPTVAAVVEAGGIPTRFLPPGDARQLFDRYREMLRSIGGELYIDARVRPIPVAAFRVPPRTAPDAPDEPARQGYRALVELLVARRRRRRVRCLLTEPLTSPESVRRLTERRRLLEGHLAAMGAAPEPLTGARLAAAVREIGWPIEEAP
jgi:hypothetical protein